MLENRVKALLIYTAFFLCVENCHTQAVEVLLDHGIEVDSRDLEWQTPLHRAVVLNCWPIMKLLLSRQACLDWRMWLPESGTNSVEGEILSQLFGSSDWLGPVS
ncbi:uncharacterized protein J3D65DRAFT_642712 [Phyllosticta citribraziliensis]|uniref:Ankyrin repeat protein n=1 Tax=Phyllosticta citribraziliensis TaxID=989973 RepID=A0ABR1L342_9PEZI